MEDKKVNEEVKNTKANLDNNTVSSKQEITTTATTTPAVTTADRKGGANKKGGAQASAYHQLSRQHNTAITEGVLYSARAKGPANPEIAKKNEQFRVTGNVSVQDQNIISTTIHYRNKTQANVVIKEESVVGNQKSTIDHSSLFIRNSPRVSQVSNNLTSSPITNMNPMQDLRRVSQPGSQVHNNNHQNSQQSNLGSARGNNKIVVSYAEADSNYQESRTPAERKPVASFGSQGTVRTIQSQHRHTRKGKLPVDTQLASFAASRTGTHAELMAGDNHPTGQMPQAMKSMQDQAFIKHENGGTVNDDQNAVRSASPCESRIQTQKGGIDMGHSSTYSVVGGSKGIMSTEAVKISVNERNSTNYRSPPKQGTFETGQASLRDVDEQSQEGTYLFTNPFNVRSYGDGRVQSNQSSPRKHTQESTGTNNMRSLKDKTSLGGDGTPIEGNNKMVNPKVEVYKVTDLLNSERNRVNLQYHQRDEVDIEKNREHFMKNVLKHQKMTNYELLKRPRTNRESVVKPNITSTNTFCLKSQRDSLHVMDGVISSDQDVKITRGATAAAAGKQAHHAKRKTTMIEPGESMLLENQFKITGKHGMFQLKQKLSSQETARQTETNATTPTRVSKTFAGGFGGAGSIYTHSHLTHARKLRSNRGGSYGGRTPATRGTTTTQRPGLTSRAANSSRMTNNTRGGNGTSSIVSNELHISGNRTGGVPDFAVQSLLQTKSMLDTQRQWISQNKQQQAQHGNGEFEYLPMSKTPLSSDTSRSPIPIDPETYKNMSRHLAHHENHSNNDLIGQKSRSREDPSREKSNHSGEEVIQYTQIKPFIMSPQHLQEQLKHQQEAIRASHTNAGYQATGPPITASNAYSNNQVIGNGAVQGKRVKVPQNKLMRDKTALTSSKNLSVETSQNLTAKRMKSSDGYNYNSFNAINNNTGQGHDSTVSGINKSQMMQNNQKILLPQLNQINGGKSVKEQGQQPPLQQQKTNVYVESLLGGANDEEAGASASIYDRPESRPEGGQQHRVADFTSDCSLLETDNLGNVAIRINNVNIAIATKPSQNMVSKGVGQSRGASIDTRVENNFSSLTNFQQRSNHPPPIFNEEGTSILETENQMIEESPQAHQVQSSPGLKNLNSRFKPVLQSKIYRGTQQQQDTIKRKSGGSSIATSPRSVAKFKFAETQVDTRQMMSPTEVATKRNSRHENDESKRDKNVSGLDNSRQCSPSIDEKLRPAYTHPSDIEKKLEQNADLQEKDDDPDAVEKASSSEIESAALNQMLKFDEQSWAKCRPKDYASLDFVALKTHEFLHCQQKIKGLDHNSGQSDRKRVIDQRTDLLMKDIALSARKQYKQGNFGNDENSGELFDVNQRRQITIKNPVPSGMIKFKNKSEQMRYTRIANCIVALNDQTQQKSKNDIEFTYMKIFRFLADILSSQEFESLSYFQVSRFIGNILKLAFEDESVSTGTVLNQISLRKFVCNCLSMKYSETQKSHDVLLHGQFGQTQQQREPHPSLWSRHDFNKLDLNSEYSNFNVTYRKHESHPLEIGKEERHKRIQDKITREVRSFAHEPRLQAVIRHNFFKHKETIPRQNLARLLKSNKNQNDLDYANLSKESTLARNQIVLEHIVASRNMREWKNECLAEIHTERRERRNQAKSQATSRRHTTRLC